MENRCPSKENTSCYRELVENNIGLVGHVVYSFAPRNKQRMRSFTAKDVSALLKQHVLIILIQEFNLLHMQ